MVHLLLVYQRSRGKLVIEQEFPTHAAARADRFWYEQVYRNDPDLEIVVLSADSIETIKQTHGRYWMS